MALNPGDTLLNGQYRIQCLLGRGGFGFVYHAVDTYVDEPVAIKELIPALLSDETLLKRFLAEAKTTMRLTHPHIVRTHHVFPEGGNYYIVMEYMAGGSLEERLQKEGRLAVDKAVRIAIQVCDGLSCAHDRGIVHCDLKPANVLFAADGTAKVADFGIAHVPEEMLTRSWATPAGFVAGTLPYMSPEQAEGVRDDPRMDLYSLGAVLYRMLTGKTYLSFDLRETPGAQADNVLRIRNDPPTPPRAHEPSIPIWLNDIVLKALNKECSERFDSAEAFRSALEGQMPAAHPPTSSVGVPEPTLPRLKPTTVSPGARPPTHRAWFWLVAGGSSILALATIVVLMALIPGVKSGQNTPTESPSLAVASEMLPFQAAQTLTTTLQATAFLASSTPAPRATNTSALGTVEVPLSISQPTPKPTHPPSPTSSSTATASPSLTPERAPTPTLQPTPELPGTIAFATNRYGYSEICTIHADGSNLTRLTFNQVFDWHPNWSPDGKRLVFVTNRDGSGKDEIYLMNADGSAPVRIMHNDAQDDTPAWHPSGSRIFFSSLRDGNWELYSVGIDGSDLRRLTDHPALDQYPTIAPEGRQMAFVSERDGNREIYVANTDGSDVQRLTFRGEEDGAPAWSPHGDWIAFASKVGQEEWALFLIKPDGSGLSRLTYSGGEYPAWSPDGTKIVFLAARQGIGNLYIVNVDGSHERRLTDHSDVDWSPAWSK